MINKTWKKVMKMGHYSISIVNLLNERPARDPNSSVMIQYQHGGVNVGGSSFSSRVTFRLLHHSNHMILTIRPCRTKYTLFLTLMTRIRNLIMKNIIMIYVMYIINRVKEIKQYL